MAIVVLQLGLIAALLQIVPEGMDPWMLRHASRIELHYNHRPSRRKKKGAFAKRNGKTSAGVSGETSHASRPWRRLAALRMTMEPMRIETPCSTASMNAPIHC